MAFPKGVSGNPSGMSKQQHQLLNKVRNSLNKAVDGLGTASKDGTTVMAELITQALKDDVVGTLKAFSQFIPKELNVDVTHTQSAKSLTDDQLADIIAERARARLLEEKVINPEQEETVINQ